MIKHLLYHLPKFTCTTLVTIWNVGGISNTPSLSLSLPLSLSLSIYIYIATYILVNICMVKFRIHFLNPAIPFSRTNLVIYKAFCLEVVQGRMNGAPNKTRTHSWRFASLACKPLHHPRHPALTNSWKQDVHSIHSCMLDLYPACNCVCSKS